MRKRKFAEGGYSEGEDYPTKDIEPIKVEAPSGGSFKDAFRAARKAGDKSFVWNGKKYNTELAQPKKSAPKPPAESYRSERPSAMPISATQPKQGVLSGYEGNVDPKTLLPFQRPDRAGMKRGGTVKKMASGGMTRGDGCCQRGGTKGKMR